MRKKIAAVIIGPIIVMSLTGYIYFAIPYEFHGKVIDADTRQPIEGAVVVASWSEETATIAGPSSRSKDVKETLTDKNGNWAIKGLRGRKGEKLTDMFTFVTGTYYTRPPEFIVFKPGYCSWPAGFSIDACRNKINPSLLRDGPMIELPKLTIRERETLLMNKPFIPFEDGVRIPIFKKLAELDIAKP